MQRTVLDGELPALLVVHTAENDWCVGDGINDPNEPAAWVASHMKHVIERNSSVATLANLPPGHQAQRDAPGSPWIVSHFEFEPEP